MKQRIATIIVLLAILGGALCLRLPYLSNGLPYFYDEDEAHHFDRLIEMVQNHDLNPHYFHKPSLHFYLRIPAVLLGAAIEHSKGTLESLKSVRTKDPYGIGGYAFSASHPTIVKWARSVSLILSLGIVLWTFLIGRELWAKDIPALCAAAVTATLPPLVQYSATIGVDTPMAFMVLGSIYFGIRLAKEFSLSALLLCGIFSGLAISTKYNAAPIGLLPLVACILSENRRKGILLLSVALPAIFFLLGTPYLIVSLREFYDQASYEVWHYAIAGHEGNTAERGIPQLLFYINWFWNSAIGWPLTLFAGCGLALMLATRERATRAFMLFPILFFVMMVLQRANFTRNMLVLLPCLVLAAHHVVRKMRSSLIVASLAFGAVPLSWVIQDQEALMSFQESRVDAGDYLRSISNDGAETAVWGTIQFEPATLQIPGVTVVSPDMEALAVFNSGFSKLLTIGGIGEQVGLLQEKEFGGETSPQRIIKSPRLRLYKFDENQMLERVRSDESLPTLSIPLTAPGAENDETPACARGSEHYCWISKRVSLLRLTSSFGMIKPRTTIRFELMSPWDRQSVSLFGKEEVHLAIDQSTVGRWVAIDMAASNDLVSRPIRIELSEVHSPREMRGEQDSRRLGVAIRAVRVLK